jgi:hypothetical protein
MEMSRTSTVTTSIRAWRASRFAAVILLLALVGLLVMREQHDDLNAASILFHEATMASHDKHPGDPALDSTLARVADTQFAEERALRRRAGMLAGAELLIAALGVTLVIVRFSGRRIAGATGRPAR